MFSDLKVFRLAGALAEHASQRQAVLAQNVANADTPGYRARDISGFAATLAETGGTATMRATRPSHLNGALAGAKPTPLRAGSSERPGMPDPNGNTVVLEEELMFAANTRRQHDRALAIYRSALDILRAGIRVR